VDSRRCDVVCVGAGIVGLATAMSLARRFRCSPVVVEAEDRPATHQTRHNSGVIHSGLYYRPGSSKARNCVQGRKALCRFCDEHDVPYQITGKLVVATRPQEVPLLADLGRRGRANGLAGLRRLEASEIGDYEPHARGLAGLLVPETGIIDFELAARAYGRVLEEAGGEICTASRVVGIRVHGGELVVDTTRGSLVCSHLINCAGLQSDRVARLAGLDPGVRIIPFRGDYFELLPERRHLVRNHLYPVPDSELPFLGVHLTRRVDGRVEAGPNAVLALRRDRYQRWSFSSRDAAATLLYPGFWRMVGHNWRAGAQELARTGSRRRFARAVQRFVPEVRPEDLRPAGCGIRAQAVDRKGRLLDDFHILETERMLHVLNAPSPAATASLAIGETLAARAAERFGLPVRS
jgi:L-2-hydroxyglutarate oxidase